MPAPELASAEEARADEGTAQTVAEIRAAVDELPPKYRLAISAYYLQEHSYEEAASMAGVTVRAFKTRLYRARQHLARLLEGPVRTGKGQP